MYRPPAHRGAPRGGMGGRSSSGGEAASVAGDATGSVGGGANGDVSPQRKRPNSAARARELKPVWDAITTSYRVFNATMKRYAGGGEEDGAVAEEEGGDGRNEGEARKELEQCKQQ